MNIFQQMFAAVTNKNKYAGFLKHKSGKVFGYGVLLVTFSWLLTILIPYVGFQIRTGGFRQLILTQIPDFRLENGTLWVEEKVSFREDRLICVEIDTDRIIPVGEYDDYSYLIIVDREKIAVKDYRTLETIYYDKMDGVVFERTTLLSYVKWVNIFVVAGMILLYLVSLASFFFGVLIMSLLGLVINASLGVGLRFGQIYSLTLYARTTSMLLKGLLGLLGLVIPLFWLLAAGITFVYLILALLAIKKQQTEAARTD